MVLIFLQDYKVMLFQRHYEAMLRFQPKINGNSIESTLQSDILSTSLLHP